MGLPGQDSTASTPRTAPAPPPPPPHTGQGGSLSHLTRISWMSGTSRRWGSLSASATRTGEGSFLESASGISSGSGLEGREQGCGVLGSKERLWPLRPWVDLSALSSCDHSCSSWNTHLLSTRAPAWLQGSIVTDPESHPHQGDPGIAYRALGEGWAGAPGLRGAEWAGGLNTAFPF